MGSVILLYIHYHMINKLTLHFHVNFISTEPENVLLNYSSQRRNHLCISFILEGKKKTFRELNVT